MTFVSFSFLHISVYRTILIIRVDVRAGIPGMLSPNLKATSLLCLLCLPGLTSGEFKNPHQLFALGKSCSNPNKAPGRPFSSAQWMLDKSDVVTTNLGHATEDPGGAGFVHYAPRNYMTRAHLAFGLRKPEDYRIDV